MNESVLFHTHIKSVNYISVHVIVINDRHCSIQMSCLQLGQQHVGRGSAQPMTPGVLSRGGFAPCCGGLLWSMGQGGSEVHV